MSSDIYTYDTVCTDVILYAEMYVEVVVIFSVEQKQRKIMGFAHSFNALEMHALTSTSNYPLVFKFVFHFI